MFCEVCKMHIINNQAWEEHIIGEKHQSSLIAGFEATGIFIRGIDERFKYNILKSYFSRFGKIEEIIINKKHNYAIIEYKESESAKHVLSRQMRLLGKLLRIFPRKVNRVTSDAFCKTASTSANFNEDNDDYPLSSNYISIDAFDIELDNFITDIEAKEMRSKVAMLCQSLKLALSYHYPECQIHPFGSSITGLGVTDSDVDIFVDLGGEMSHTSADKIVRQVKFRLNRFKEFSKIVAIPRAKVPIIKCFHKSTNLQCDLSFKNQFGIQNSNLIKFFISMEPRLRAILMLLKYWTKIHELNGPRYLTSYALVMLLFYYLQQLTNPILPSVEKLQSLCKTELKVEGWDCHFKCCIEDLNREAHIDSSLNILSDFFSFYSLFSFKENIIILRSAIAVSRSMTAEPPENSPWFKYKNIIEKANTEIVNLDKPMCVLDPFVLNHNITANMDLRGVNRFQIYCHKAFKVCEKIRKGEVSSLQALFAINPINKIKYPFVLESWEDNGDIDLIIPVSSFSPKNSIVVNKNERDPLDFEGNLKLLIEHIINILENVIKFVLVRTDCLPDNGSPSRKILKTEEMEDTNSNTKISSVPPSVHIYQSFYQVWNNRNKVYNKLSLPKHMKYIEKEKHVTDYIIENIYKGSIEGLKQIDLNCIFSPYMGERCLRLKLTASGGCKSIKPITAFLLKLLYNWLDK